VRSTFFIATSFRDFRGIQLSSNQFASQVFTALNPIYLNSKDLASTRSQIQAPFVTISVTPERQNVPRREPKGEV